ncbi:MAG TPA: AAA family ATPase [Candidatus Paceibacterota bacterium]
MIVFLGGFFGSGRESLADKLADTLGFFCLDVYSRKDRWRALQGGVLREYVREPKHDADTLCIYERVVEEFPLLSRMYPDVVIHDSFHRRSPRTYLLDAAREHFGDPVFVWIEASDERAYERFLRRRAMGVISDVERAVALRRRQREEFEQFVDTPTKILNDGSGRDALPILSRLVQEAVV